MFSKILNKGKEIAQRGASSSRKPKLVLQEVLQDASHTERQSAVKGDLEKILKQSKIPRECVSNFHSSGRSQTPSSELYDSDDEAKLVDEQEKVLENAPYTVEQKTQLKSDLYKYFAGRENDKKALENLSINIPHLSVPLSDKKKLFRGTMLPEDVVSDIMKVCKTGDFNKIKDMTYELLHGFDKGKKFKNICSVSTVGEVAKFFSEVPHNPNEKTHIFISLEPNADMPPKGLVSFDNLIAVPIKEKFKIKHEHEILLDPTNNYAITGKIKHFKDFKEENNFIIHVNAWNDVAHKAQQLKIEKAAIKAQQLKLEKAAIPFLPTLPILAIGGLIGAGGYHALAQEDFKPLAIGGLIGAGSYITKKIYDQKKMAYLGQEYDRRVEALEADPIAKFITEEALKAPKETTFSDISTIIKKYNENNKVAQEKYKKDIINIFIPYKKQKDSHFYEQNLAGKDVTFYNDIIPETSSSDVTPKHFSWLANNDTIPITPTLYDRTQDLNGMQPIHTGNIIHDDTLNRKTAFMIKVMKKYSLDIKNADTIENFHKIDLNQLNYNRALRLFKVDHCPAKAQFEKIRNIIKGKYAEFNKDDASLDEKEKYLSNNIANVITKEAENNNSNLEFIRTLTALVVAEWYNVKRQHTAA